MARSVTRDEFVDAWERCMHPHDVDDQFAQRRGWATSRASRYRSRGVRLKTFKGVTEVSRLNAMIDKIRSEPA
tara:strand:+ start:7853 stop:8071 length:219 start_codon:yes stop_codon:yes gene_type:complete